MEWQWLPGPRPGQGPRPDRASCWLVVARAVSTSSTCASAGTCSARCHRTRRLPARSTRSTPSTRPGLQRRWPRCAARSGPIRRRRRATAPVLLDIDASLVEIHSEGKEQTAPPSRAGSDSIRCSASPTQRARRCPRSCARATPAPTPSPITSRSSTMPSPSCPVTSLVVTTRETIPHWSTVTSSCGPTRPGAPRTSWRPVGLATWASIVSARSNAQVTAAIFDAIGIEEVWLPPSPRTGSPKTVPRWPSSPRLIDDDEVPRANPADHPTRTPPPRGPAQPLPLSRLPLLGLLHRPGRRPEGTRRHHAGPRPRRDSTSSG